MHWLHVRLSHYFLKDINPVIRCLITSDAIIIGSAALMGPIFAIFIEDFIQGGNMEVAGIAAGIYLFTKSLMQIPIAYFIDKIKGEKDDYWLMFSFSLVNSLIPLLYLIVKTPSGLYFVQFLLGICAAFMFPAYMGIFTRHIDQKREATEWGLYFTTIDFLGAMLASVGGVIAYTYGFRFLIVLITMLSFSGALILWPIRRYIDNYKKNK